MGRREDDEFYTRMQRLSGKLRPVIHEVRLIGGPRDGEDLRLDFEPWRILSLPVIQELTILTEPDLEETFRAPRTLEYERVGWVEGKDGARLHYRHLRG